MATKISSRILVMTLNLRFGLADDGPHSWPYRKKALASLLEMYPADFYAFQEANDFQIEFIRQVLTDYDFIGQRKPAPSFWQNNVVFYHRRTWKLTGKDHFFLSPTPDIPSRFRQSRWPRQCTFGRFASGNGNLVCINTHLDFKDRIQQAGAQIILRRLEKFDARTPAILMGDFNCGEGSSAYRVFTQTIEAAPFHNVFKKNQPGTHHDFTGVGRGKAIDWILYRGAIEPLTAQVITQRFAGSLVSDHFPVKAEFSWSGHNQQG